MSDSDGGEKKGRRLQAYLADCGVGSRRSCEELIREGRVNVGGQTAPLGSRVEEGDEVRLDGKLLKPQSRLRYILLNKPPGYLTTMSDPEGRPIASDLLEGAGLERVYNVGRLDQWSCGLILFTNDGNLAARMGHPSGGFEKEYVVEADKDIPQDFFDRFSAGVTVEGVFYKANFLQRTGPRSAKIVLVEGRNREIRRVLAHWDIRALSLRRVRIGPLSIGTLAEGKWRDLDPAEVESLGAEGAARGRP